jgi:Flp pilus assembly protein TadD
MQKGKRRDIHRKLRAGRPSRRRWPRWAVPAAIAVVIVIGAVAAVLMTPGQPRADLRRIPGENVLLVTIDTLRADALGCYGGPAATPALDWLAAQGVRFEFAHAHAVLTLPSHASILTGQYPFQHGLRNNSGYRLPRDARTIATLLKHAGYATAAFVAGFPVHSRFGLNVGFDVYDDHFDEGLAPTVFNMPERPASVVVPLALNWIASGAAGGQPRPDARGRGDRPWFVWVHLFDPHAPYRPPPPFDTRYASQPYYGEVAATDAALAPLLEDVHRSAKRTLVIVTGDHGEGLGDHGEQAHGVFAYESTLRVPLIVAQLGGGRARGGEVSSVSVRHVDILPTILDAVGQPLPPGLPGRTLLPAGERDGTSAPRPTYFEAMSGMLDLGWAPLTGVVLGRDKFIDLPIVERYDLAGDAGERSNLAGRVPERDRVLAAALTAFKPVLPGPRITEGADAVARLRALGYISGNAPVKGKYTEADDPKRLVQFDNAIHRAVEAFGDGRLAEAAQIYRDMLQQRPDMAIAYLHLAVTEWRQGDASSAVEVLRGAVARGITEPRVLTQLGEYLTDTGRLAEAIRMLEPLARIPEPDAETLVATGIAYARAGRADEARATFERLAQLLPASSVPLENLGVLAMERGDVAAARTYFNRALAIAPGSARAYAGLGAAAFRSGDRQAAYDAWRRAVQLDPANVDALYSLGVNLARDGRMDAARPYLEQFLRNAPPTLPAAERQEVSRLLQSIR